jgi:hypothetical protein
MCCRCPLSEWLSVLLVLLSFVLLCIQLQRTCVVPIDFSYGVLTANGVDCVGGEGFRRLAPPPLAGLGV